MAPLVNLGLLARLGFSMSNIAIFHLTADEAHLIAVIDASISFDAISPAQSAAADRLVTEMSACAIRLRCELHAKGPDGRSMLVLDAKGEPVYLDG